VIERGLAVFLVSFTAIGFLLGSFEGRDALVAAGVSTVIALVVVFWLRRGERQVEESFFDERATRRAVRRGVIRTALAAVIPLFVISVVVSTASRIWQMRDGRADRFEHVAEYGFFVGHLDFRPTDVRGDLTHANFRSLELPLQVIPRSATPLVQQHTLRLRLDLRGRLDEGPLLDLPPSGVGTALANRPATQAELEAFERLSSLAVASAAVELREPLSVGDFQHLLSRHGLLGLEGEGVGIFLEGPDAAQRRSGSFAGQRVGWPNPFAAQFQSWTKGLSAGDDPVLERLGLPSSRELLELAADPGIHGFVLDAATPRQLRGLRAEPKVSTISLGDVAFDFGEDR
jgi:hypothetical protein